LEEAAKRVQEIHDAAKSVNPDVMVICHGGPIAEPEDVEYIFAHTKGIVGSLVHRAWSASRGKGNKRTSGAFKYLRINM